MPSSHWINLDMSGLSGHEQLNTFEGAQQLVKLVEMISLFYGFMFIYVVVWISLMNIKERPTTSDKKAVLSSSLLQHTFSHSWNDLACICDI